MAKKKVIANHKGGVGKTATVITVAAILGSGGNKVLVVDLDGQSDSSDQLLQTESRSKPGVFDLLVDEDGELNTAKCIYKCSELFENCYLIAADSRLDKVGDHINSRIGKEFIVKNLIAPLESKFDYIIYDTPPNLGTLTINALVASDDLIIPIDLSQKSIKNARKLLKVVEILNKSKLPTPRFDGLLICRYEKSNSNETQLIVSELEEEFKSKVINIRIPASIKVREADRQGCSIFHKSKFSPTAKAYRKLVENYII